MDRLDELTLPPSQTAVIERGAVVAGLAGGTVGFGVTGLLLLEEIPLTSGMDVAAWVMPLAAWTLSWLPVLRRQRAAVQVIALLMLLAMPLLAMALGEGATAEATWIPISAVAFAAVVVAAFTLEWRAALAAVFVASALDAWLNLARPPMVLTVDPSFAAGLAGALLAGICGSLLVLVRDRWLSVAHEMDVDVTLLAEMYDVNEREAHLLQVRAAVDRRIHETVLNTLTALSSESPPGNPSGVIEACRRDLHELEEGLRPWLPSMASTVIADAISAITEAHSPEGFACTSVVTFDAVLSAASAEAARDAIVEALRNVQRHAGVPRATVTSQESRDPTDEGTNLVIEIRDEGSGLALGADERFGVRQAIRGSLAAVGGEATVESEPGRGTVVRLTLPTGVMDREPLPDITVDDAIERSFAGRIGLMCTPIFAAVIAVPMAIDVGWRAALPWLMLLAAPVNLALARWWNTRARIPLALAALAVAGLAMFSGCVLALELAGSACLRAPGLIWLQSALLGGGLILVMLAFGSTLARIAILVYGVVLGGALVASLPSTCADDALLPLVTSTLYLVVIVLLVEWGQRRIARGLHQARAVRARVRSQRLAMDAQAARVAGWSRLNADITVLLADVADGRLDVGDPVVRSRARIEAAALRGLLGREPTRRGPTMHLVASMMEIAVHIDCTIDAEAISATARHDLLPVPIQDMVMGFVVASAGRTVALRVLVDEDFEEYLLTVPTSALEEVTSRTANVIGSVDDCVVEAFPGTEGTSLVSIRRPFSVSATPT